MNKNIVLVFGLTQKLADWSYNNRKNLFWKKGNEIWRLAEYNVVHGKRDNSCPDCECLHLF